MEATVNGNVHTWDSIRFKPSGEPLAGVTCMQYVAKGGYTLKLHPLSKRKQRQARVRHGLLRRAKGRRPRDPRPTTEAELEARLLRMFGARSLVELADQWGVASVRVVRDLDGKLCIATVARAYPEMIDVTVGFM